MTEKKYNTNKIFSQSWQDMENVKYCEASPVWVQAAWKIGLSTGLGVYAVLGALGLILTRKHVSMLVSYHRHAQLARLVPALTLVGAVAFLADAHKDRHSLVTCDPWGGLQWVAFLVHLCFVVRLAINWGVTYRPQVMATVVDVWLFIQACIALDKGFNLYAFTFLTLIRFFHSECLTAWSRLSTLMRAGFGAVLAVLVVAGALQVAEEHSTLHGTHSTTQGTLQPIRSFWSYVYWTVVTLSTVGYGEITPSTNAGKILASVVMFLGVIWYYMVVSKMNDVVKKYFQEGRYPPPESSHPRVIVLGESDPNNLTRLLTAVKLDDDNDLEVILLVPGEVTPRYHRLSSVLPMKVVSCTNLQEDLTSLLPCTDSKRYSEARQRDAVVLFGDHESEDPEAEDIRVMQLLVLAREIVPDKRFIVQVLLSRSRRAVQQTPCWSAQDVVVCLEELIVDLLAQTAACSAAASIMSTLLNAPTTSSRGELEHLRHLHNFRETQKIYLCEPIFEAEDFVEAAFKLYEEHGDLLLGWFSPETKDFELLPDELPLGVQWVIISGNAELVQKPLEIVPIGKAVDCCGGAEEVSVAVRGAEPGCTALQAALQEFPVVRLLPEEEWRSASTVVMTTAGMALSYVIQAHYMRTHVMQDADDASETKCIRFLTDVPYGQGQRAWDQRTTSDVVNKSLVVSAVAAAILDHNLYDIWRRLAANHNVVGVRILVDCTYGEAFRELLLKQRLLPVGVNVVRKMDCCITNPPAMLSLAPGSLLLCLLITPPAVNFSLPPVIISQGTVTHRNTM